MTRKAAPRPPTRTVDIALSGAYEGWAATARADFPARLLADLQSGNIGSIISVLDVIITDHNFPNSDGEIAESMGDVDPYEGLIEAGGEVFDAIGKLPNR